MPDESDNKFDPTLIVNAGISQPPSVNPVAADRYRKRKLKMLSEEEYLDGLLNGDRTILGKVITLIESALPEHHQMAQSIIAKCLPHSGNSIRIGITGVPGVGKSTFIETLGSQLTSSGNKLAVLAIDPSSKRTKGSILGDKTRMETLSADSNAFIRPSPSAGTLGGVARKTHESVLLCEAAGFNIIFIETVGVGQSETTVYDMVDFFLLLMLAGGGDELQGIKRGIMEMADAVVINKADGDNAARANLTAAQMQNAIRLFPAPVSGWQPIVATCSALTNFGIKEVWDNIES
ncbi:MAG TPA: methylmalonyl Co-A mutase-associated GTPase MeaB, partial [Bacteroidales bacterium]|nr:methylmalonyl Co-A mutase-associated GTPase MeaB [Bacteroidales bacterium]